MPRRTRPLLPMAIAGVDAAGAEKVRGDIEGIFAKEATLRRLPSDKRAALVAALADAIGFAKAGLADILTGKRVKPAAWTMDIVVRDVCDALHADDLPVSMAYACRKSLAQRLADAVGAMAGLPDQGELFKQMQRARDIEKAGAPTCPGRPLLVLGEWRIRT
jgi:hypothetical protein